MRNCDVIIERGTLCACSKYCEFRDVNQKEDVGETTPRVWRGKGPRRSHRISGIWAWANTRHRRVKLYLCESRIAAVPQRSNVLIRLCCICIDRDSWLLSPVRTCCICIDRDSWLLSPVSRDEDAWPWRSHLCYWRSVQREVMIVDSSMHYMTS